MLPDLDSLAHWDERLRQVPANPAAVEQAIDLARERLAVTEDARERSRLHGYLGNAARLLGRDEEALREHRRSLELAPDAEARTVARIRIGETHRCFDRLEDAEAWLREALRDAGELRDFALQHLGKTLLDQGRVEEAVVALESALALRRAKGDDALVASTEQALLLARRRVV